MKISSLKILRTFVFFVIVLFFVFDISPLTLFASESNGTIDSSSTTIKVCHDTTCASGTGGTYGLINMKPTGFTAITINDTTGITGQAWGNELGTITFNPIGGGVSINTTTGQMSGYAYTSIGGWMKVNPTGVTPVTINCSGEWNGWAWVGGIGGGWVKFSASGITTPSTPADTASSVKTDWRPTTCRGSTTTTSSGGGGGNSGFDYCPNTVGYQSSTDFCPAPVVVPPVTLPAVTPVTPLTPVIPTKPTIKTSTTSTTSTTPPTPPPTLPTIKVIGETPVPPETTIPITISNLLSTLEIPPRFFDVTVYKKNETTNEKNELQEKGLFYELLGSKKLKASLRNIDLTNEDVTFIYIGDTMTDLTQQVVQNTRTIPEFLRELFFVDAKDTEVSPVIKQIPEALNTNASRVEFTVPEKPGLYVMRITSNDPNAGGKSIFANANILVAPKGDAFHSWWFFGWHTKSVPDAKVTLLKNNGRGEFVVWDGSGYDEISPDLLPNGTYGMTVPKGDYKIMMTAPGYHTYTGDSVSFLSDGRIVNDRVELVCRFWGGWGCLWPIKVLVVAIIVVLSWFIYKLIYRMRANKKEEYSISAELK